MSDKCEWDERQYDYGRYWFTSCQEQWDEYTDIPDICPFCGKEVSR